MRSVLGWLGRTGLLYAVLFAALAFFVLAWPSIAPILSGDNLRREAMSLDDIRAETTAARIALQRDLDAAEQTIRGAGADEITAQLRAAQAERAEKRRELAQGTGWLDSVSPSRILARKQLELELAVLDRRIDLLEGRLPVIEADAAAQRLRMVPTRRAIDALNFLCIAAGEELAAFNQRGPIDQQARELFLNERATLEREAERRCDTVDEKVRARGRGIAAARAAEDARQEYARLRTRALTALPDTSDRLPRATLREIAIMALFALIAAIAIPFVIRLFFWFVLAPIAERRAAIRLNVPGAGSGPRLTAGQSAPSAQVKLAAGEELLVRERYLQTSPGDAEKRTRFLLDWRHPLSSLASGMWFLTRVRGDDTVTTISAADNPFSEALVLTLPVGGSCTLQPRTLAAVVQPQGSALRITSHWRLFSLNAWLTFQLRFLVFHGPARLVLIGGRGIRVETADSGRIFAPRQLVGFSADLDYAVIRNETFWPYFLGRQPLLRDRVMRGEGVLVIEEAPDAGRRGRGAKGGLEGMMDAVLKAFGI